MPRLKHSIVAELPAPEQLDFAQLARDCADGSCDLVVVLGPTASGKTRYAVALAERLGGEIISADSRQVYRGMDIGTGKDLAEYGSVPYHLIDIAEPGTQYNVWQFQQDFLRAYADIRRRGAMPILCGGTGMYINAVTRGYDFSEKQPLSAAREDISREGFPQRPFFIGTLVDRDTRNARIANYAFEDFEYQTFGMFDGDPEVVTLRVDAPMMDVIVDRFGRDIELVKSTPSYAEVRVKIRKSPQFFGWLAGLNGGVSIKTPKRLSTEYKEWLKSLIEKQVGE